MPYAIRVAQLEAQGVNTGPVFSHREYALIYASGLRRSFEMAALHFLAAILSGDKALMSDAVESLDSSINPWHNQARAKQIKVMEEAMDIVFNLDEGVS